MGFFDPLTTPLKRTVKRGQDRMKEQARDLVLTTPFARDPDVDLVVKTAILESVVALPTRLGPGHLAATVLRHPLLRDALHTTTLTRLRSELLATKEPRRTTLALRVFKTQLKEMKDMRHLNDASPLAFGSISGVHWSAKTSFVELLRTLESDHSELRAALASLSSSTGDRASISPISQAANGPYRAVIDEARVVVPMLRSATASHMKIERVDLYVITDGAKTTRPILDSLVDAFELPEVDAFFLCEASHVHGAALIATLPQPEAEERTFAATRRLRSVGSSLTFRMLRPRAA